ncbi:death-associated protein kinase dapk-1-like [Schistocerca americana]|uniref:death-associated protein kinase dapk-1-like n=1 Tax=Schistocerca americana TaxID=7009 RepID=UPI001F4FB3D5|nr:death-associated protein kinase dapk-1-like [Schistocerca americana]
MDFITEPFENFYDVFEDIGKGQFAVVRRCQERSTGRQFAAKFVRKRRVCRGVSQEDIRREVHLLRRLAGHPHLVTLHQAFDSPRHAVLVLEMLEGGELSSLLESRGHLEETESAYCAHQILLALQHMHSQNIAHLDLKPENILLVGGGLQLKLVDLGLSQELEPGTHLRTTLATPEFAAPEIVSYEPLSLATDMWALGVITYLMLSGISPFLGEDKQETYSNIAAVSYTFDENAFSRVSTAAKDFVTKLLLKDSSKRATVTQCLDHSWIQACSLSLSIVKPKIEDNIRKVTLKTKKHWKQSLRAVQLCLQLQATGGDCSVYTDDGDNFVVSALNSAASSGNVEGLQKLMSLTKISLNVSNKERVSPAHVAAGCGQVSVLELLNTSGANLQAKDDSGDTPLIWAARHGQEDALSFLVNAGVNVSTQNLDGGTALHEAALHGRTTCVRRLIACPDISLDIPDCNGRTPLHVALATVREDCALLLLHAGADVDMCDMEGDAPIHLASRTGLLTAAQTLCAFGCTVDIADADGLYPIHLAARYGHGEVVRCLCLAGCNTDQKNTDGIRAEITALKHGFNDVANLLAKLKNRDELIRQLIPTSKPPSRLSVKFLGRTGSGKTTLISSLTAGLITGLLRKARLSPSSAPSRTGSTSPGSKMQIEMDVTSCRGQPVFDVYNEHYTRGIDVQEVSVSGCGGDLTLWELSGQETYFLIYHHFLGSTACLHVVVYSLADPPSAQLEQCLFWLTFLQARTVPPLEPLGEGGVAGRLPLVLLVGTHADMAGRYADSAARRLITQLRTRFRLQLELLPQTIVLDARIPGSPGIRQLEAAIAGVRQRLLLEVPRWTGFLEASLSWLSQARRLLPFPVMPWSQFVAAVRDRVNPLAGEEHLRELAHQLEVTGEIVQLRTPAQDELVVLSPRWLGQLIGQLLSPDFLVKARTTGCYSSHDFQAAVPQLPASDVLPVLEALGLCARCYEDEDIAGEFEDCDCSGSECEDPTVKSSCATYIEPEPEFEFPCFNFVETLDGLWDARYHATCYGGLRLRAPAPSSCLLRCLFPRFQVQLRRCTQQLSDPDTDLYQWMNGSKLCTGAVESQAVLIDEMEIDDDSDEDDDSDSKSGLGQDEWLELKVRGPPGSALACFCLLEELLAVIDQVVSEVSPGMALEKHALSPAQLRCHTSDPYCWAPEQLMKAILKSGLSASLRNPRTGGSESLLDIIGFGEPEVLQLLVTADRLSVSALSTLCRQRLCLLLDPPDPLGRDWCLLAVRLGLLDELAHIDGSASAASVSRTAALLDAWGGTIGQLITTLEELGRQDAVAVLLKNAPLYRITLSCQSPVSSDSSSRLSR